TKHFHFSTYVLPSLTLYFCFTVIHSTSSTSIFVNSNLVSVSIGRGVKQGDALSPKLFNATLQMTLDSIDWGQSGLRMGGKQLHTLEYADDVTLLATSRPMLGKMLELLTKATSKVGLKINSKKTTLLTSCTSTGQPIVVSGMTFRFADHAQYLGRISFPLDQTAEVSQQIQSGWNVFKKLEIVLCSKTTPLNLKKRAFDSCVTPAVLYDGKRDAYFERYMEQRTDQKPHKIKGLVKRSNKKEATMGPKKSET
ncbi:hypothetical protein OESDEN_23084, partial [Oesophagostomum dentatum]